MDVDYIFPVSTIHYPASWSVTDCNRFDVQKESGSESEGEESGSEESGSEKEGDKERRPASEQDDQDEEQEWARWVEGRS